MKAIVANVLFGGVFGCLSWIDSVRANPFQPTISKPPIVSIELLKRDKQILPQVYIPVDRILTINKSSSPIGSSYERSSIFYNNFPSYLNLNPRQNVSLKKSFYTHQSEQSNLILGFQNTFWPSAKKRKYWGITTVDRWGKNSSQKLDLSRLNYTDSPPILSSGSSALTVSGGGNNNLVGKIALNRRINPAKKFEEFRGGVTYHHGIANDLTVGMGFVYEDLLVGFTQLSYQSDIFPLQTTLSLLAKDSDVNIHSHVRFQPADNFVINYHNVEKQHKFDLNWAVISGLTLTAKANSKQESYSTGINIVIKNSYLAFSATAALDNEHQLQWKFNSQIGPFKFSHNSNERKSISELDVNLLDFSSFGVRCSAFVKHQARELKKEQEEFVIWGGRLHSARKVGSNKHHWMLDLGYGSGSKGKGLIANGSLALNPNLFLQLSYQEVSPVSDTTKVKLQLESK